MKPAITIMLGKPGAGPAPVDDEESAGEDAAEGGEEECVCPKCGHAGPASEFSGESADPEVEREARRAFAKSMR